MDGSTVVSWITLTFIRFFLPFFTSFPNYPTKNHNCHNIGEYQFYKTHYLSSHFFLCYRVGRLSRGKVGHADYQCFGIRDYVDTCLNEVGRYPQRISGRG